uniref:Uncharacterized protein AlNc14C107G6249 n=1 Tax=Albugo laibachii Nc14 TaxID=890382 RepID=F0WI42_9STRA|nr:conserved hypothetical protein [Albugo laibachii Nc14]|eukprot:CCA20920.1 conserved hypothetical protein [Albugo laibachii Nc14]
MSNRVATSFRDVAKNGATIKKLILKKSQDLVCKNLMCEKIGGACACRLAHILTCVPKLTHLDLSNNSLETIPEAVFGLQDLKYLNLAENKLSSLPQDVMKLQELEYLDLSGNDLSEVASN